MDLCILPIVLITSYVVGAFGAVAPETFTNIGIAIAAVVLVAAVSQGTYAARLARLGRISALCALCALLSWELRLFFSQPVQTAWQIVLAAVSLLLGAGVVIEWRSRRLGTSAPWTLPLAITLLGGLTVALGSLEHWAYTAGLGLPYGALAGDTMSKVLVGIIPLAVALATVLVVTGLYGLMRWLLGSDAVSSTILVLAAVMGMLTAVLLAINDGVDDARELAVAVDRRERELPYFSVITPSWVCATVRADDAAVEGGTVDESRPWVLMGEHGGRYVLWRSAADHRRVGVDVLSVSPATARTRCPS
ncbi:hypothetical protein [Modestobacter sp. VKM Ac-2978]|uniref:hypothetical protein n=1 Tax=Modestobacter sp. VKM Ac-2978 TaxID=3004132 RepID=UPI0022AAC6FA|nr:hypothetical protein [Modestobacter sp. VKM Ac-2978]MCZ2849382.1 hypothetical protein [Modestobacter sp. VKM Ac-2978]